MLEMRGQCKGRIFFYIITLLKQQIYMHSNSMDTNTSSESPQPLRRRFGDLKSRLSIQIKKIVDDDKMENEESQKISPKKSRTYTNLQQVQCMKDVVSQNGFHYEYQLGKKLGEGCHSSVFKCHCKKQNKAYAVKVTKQKDLQLFESLRESYRILKKLEHENIIQAKNLFVSQKYMTCHMVLQYCEWSDLYTYLRENPTKLDRVQVSEILTELLKTIAYMHNFGVCHRDIKPDNILYNQKKRKIKIIDFELARLRKYTNSKLEMMSKVGILSYRAPQMFHSIYDERVDIWAIGVIAYELLTRKLPFRAEHEKDLIHKILNEEPIYEGLSIWQQDFLQKLLNKDPQKRITASQALSSPFLIMNSKVLKSPPSSKQSMIKSPSLGKQDFDASMKTGFASKFYDDDVTNMFLGGNEGNIGVIKCESDDEDSGGIDEDQQMN